MKKSTLILTACLLATVSTAQYIRIRIEVSNGSVTNNAVVTIVRTNILNNIVLAAAEASTSTNPARRAADLTKQMLLNLHHERVELKTRAEAIAAADAVRQRSESNRVNDVEQ